MGQAGGAFGWGHVGGMQISSKLISLEKFKEEREGNRQWLNSTVFLALKWRFLHKLSGCISQDLARKGTFPLILQIRTWSFRAVQMTSSRSEKWNIADQGLQCNLPGNTEGHRLEAVGEAGETGRVVHPAKRWAL